MDLLHCFSLWWPYLLNDNNGEKAILVCATFLRSSPFVEGQSVCSALITYKCTCLDTHTQSSVDASSLLVILEMRLELLLRYLPIHSFACFHVCIWS